MYQKIVIVGNLGRDPEMRFSPNGQAVTNMNVATSHQYTTNSGEKVKETTWFKVAVWGKQAEACNQYLRKGSKVLVEGRMKQDKATGGARTYESNGAWRADFEVTAQTVRFLSSRSEQHAEPKAQGGYGSQEATPPQEDGIPF